jgi:hypothetical protein
MEPLLDKIEGVTNPPVTIHSVFLLVELFTPLLLSCIDIAVVLKPESCTV